MNTFRQFWGKLFSRSQKPTDTDGQSTTRPEELERRISAISGERQALAEEVHQVRSDLEHARDEEHRKLTELESLGTRFETAREADSRKVLNLERRLAELESERNQARDKARLLEVSLAETTSRLEKTDHQIKDLQAGSEEQARQFRDALSEASSRLEDTDTHVRELEDRLNSERQDYLNTIQGLLSRFRKQDVRMNWTMSIAGAALLLGTVAGILLLWEIQRNTILLSGMSRDIKELMVSVNGSLSLQRKPQEEQPQQPVLPVIPPPVARTTIAAQPKKSTEPEPRAVTPPTRADHLHGLASTRVGKRDSTRSDAKNFFEENARVDGMVSLPSGIQYQVLKSGSGKSPTLADKVVVAYVGTMVDGTIFDETYSTGLTSTFNMNEVMPGWREVLLKMEEGAEFELYVPPGLTTRSGVRKRGMLGQEPHIYLIELIEVIKEGATAPTAPAN